MTDKTSTNLDKMRARLAALENPDKNNNGKKNFAEDTVMWKLPTLEEGAKHVRLLPGSPDTSSDQRGLKVRHVGSFVLLRRVRFP